MDAVYVTRSGDRNEELRYSLRALAVHLVHDRVWISGHAPRWVHGVEVLEQPQHGTRYANSLANLTAAVEHPAISEEFVLFNDDFFVLEPLERVPVLHRGPVEPFLRKRSGRMTWDRGLAATVELLHSWGFTEVLNYELHLPLPIVRDELAAVLRRPRPTIAALAVRTLYGNACAIGGEETEDVKIHSTASAIGPGPFVSTNDHTFGTGRVGRQLRARFPEPGPYER